MKRLLFILFFIPFAASASNIILGSGSGTFVQAGNGACNPGDTMFIQAPGPYTAGSITGISGAPGLNIVILPTDWKTGGRINMTGTFDLAGKYFDCGYGSSSNFAGTALLMTGTSSNFIVHNWAGFSVQDFIDANTNKNGTYTDTSTYKWYKGAIDSIYMDSCAFLGLLSFGAVGDAIPKDIMDSVRFTRISINRTKTNGTELIGIVFRCDAHSWQINTSYRALNGDVGAMLISGNGHFYNIRKDGGVGYIGRLIIYTMAVDTSISPMITTYVWNCGQANTSDYGMFDIKNDNTEWSTHIKGGNLEGYYMTAYNLGNTINYWSAIWVIGDFYPGFYMKLKYCAGAQQVTNGKPPIVTLQGTTTGVSIDTTGSYYAASVATLQLDVSGIFPTLIPAATSPLVNKGATIAYIPKDYYAVTRPSTPTAGFAEPTPPSVPCNCIPKHGNGFGNIYKAAFNMLKPKDYIIKEKQIVYEA